MTTDEAWLWLLYAAAPAATLFPLLYTATRWWKRTTGWAIWLSKVGLAILVDSALLLHVVGLENYQYRSQVLMIGFVFITAGTWLYLFVFLRARFGDQPLPPPPEQPDREIQHAGN